MGRWAAHLRRSWTWNGLPDQEELALHLPLTVSIPGGAKEYGPEQAQECTLSPPTPTVTSCYSSGRKQCHLGDDWDLRATACPADRSPVHTGLQQAIWAVWEVSGHSVAPGRGSCQTGPCVQWIARTCQSDKSPTFTRAESEWKHYHNLITLNKQQPEKPHSLATMPTSTEARGERKLWSPRGEGTAPEEPHTLHRSFKVTLGPWLAQALGLFPS